MKLSSLPSAQFHNESHFKSLSMHIEPSAQLKHLSFAALEGNKLRNTAMLNVHYSSSTVA